MAMLERVCTCLLLILALQTFVAGDQIEVTVLCSLPDVPAEIPRLKVIEKELSPKLAKSVAQQIFGFAGTVVEVMGGRAIEVFDANSKRRLRMFKEGGFSYGTGIPKVEAMISPSEARAIAQQVFEEVKAFGLVPKFDFVFRGVEPVVEQIIPRPGGEFERQILALGAKWELRLGDLVLHGPGAELEARVGENGVLLSFSGLWRNFEQEGSVQIVGVEEALERLSSGQILNPSRSLPSQMVVENIKLGYYCRKLSEPQEYLIPSYFFESEGYTYAVSAELEVSTLGPKARRPLPPRASANIYPSTKSASPGEMVRFEILVINEENEMDQSFELEVDLDERGWVVSLDPAKLEVPAGENRKAILLAQVPENAEFGMRNRIVITTWMLRGIPEPFQRFPGPSIECLLVCAPVSSEVPSDLKKPITLAIATLAPLLGYFVYKKQIPKKAKPVGRRYRKEHARIAKGKGKRLN